MAVAYPMSAPRFERFAYVARYPLDESGDDLREEIVARDTYWSPELDATFDRLAAARQPGDPMVQGWYADENEVACMATTPQPFRLS